MRRKVFVQAVLMVARSEEDPALWTGGFADGGQKLYSLIDVVLKSDKTLWVFVILAQSIKVDYIADEVNCLRLMNPDKF